ncbi:hypothetical protein LV779_06050 [Streptomyces thinghirensis]|nr:hypothetical protein [Streptomyces thinghirensis]
MAVDRKAIVDKVFQGHAVEGEGYIPPRFPQYFFEPSADQKLAYAPPKRPGCSTTRVTGRTPTASVWARTASR